MINNNNKRKLNTVIETICGLFSIIASFLLKGKLYFLM